MSNTNTFVGTAEAARILNVCRGTLFNWEKQGVVNFYRIGRKKLYSLSEIQSLITNNTNNNERK